MDNFDQTLSTLAAIAFHTLLCLGMGREICEWLIWDAKPWRKTKNMRDFNSNYLRPEYLDILSNVGSTPISVLFSGLETACSRSPELGEFSPDEVEICLYAIARRIADLLREDHWQMVDCALEAYKDHTESAIACNVWKVGNLEYIRFMQDAARSYFGQSRERMICRLGRRQVSLAEYEQVYEQYPIIFPGKKREVLL